MATRPPGRQTRTISRSPCSVSATFRKPNATVTIWNSSSGKGSDVVSASRNSRFCSAARCPLLAAADLQHLRAKIGRDNRYSSAGRLPVGQGQITGPGADVQDRGVPFEVGPCEPSTSASSDRHSSTAGGSCDRSGPQSRQTSDECGRSDLSSVGVRCRSCASRARLTRRGRRPRPQTGTARHQDSLTGRFSAGGRPRGFRPGAKRLRSAIMQKTRPRRH